MEKKSHSFKDISHFCACSEDRGGSLSLVTEKFYVIGVRGQCFVLFFCSNFGKELVNFKCTQETMAFVQTSAK